MGQGVPIYTKCAGGYKEQPDIVDLVNKCYQWCTMYRKVQSQEWEGTWVEGGKYFCVNLYGKKELKFYHNGLLWDSVSLSGYMGNNLLSNYVSAALLREEEK